ncbi:tyrosine-type recombinase/integrase [Saccharopolyspora sp. K220]|uniref:tyrosine-type recombinase/integrase n=1 Tax=Saccharopolyspora soli TaxID=2926618 RepID=UPI001F55EF35|nr:tyrosine-type recombinase/integrase [Saccharopolyspora soli]MCI2421947.1 tyrosine-type recombinase/integrase [Saccharopolyspora soli]
MHHVHRTLRVALNEAVKREHITKNPVLVAKAPKLVEPEMEPFAVAEAQRVLDAARKRRNGARFALALSLGLRQGEALGLKWSDLRITWHHGCKECGNDDVADCPAAYPTAVMTIQRALQRQTWQHGCDEGKSCGRKRGADCPQRHGGGLVIVPPKSSAGKLRETKVRPSRLHDARHTAATMLLVLNVPHRAIMDMMGWSETFMLKRYVHVPDEIKRGIADQVGGLLWKGWERPSDEDDDGPAGALVPA